jgi:transcriptional activator
MPVHVEFGLLGPLTVRRQGALVPIAGGRQRALLAILLLEAGHPVKARQLIDAVWGPKPPASALACLHNEVSRLRDGLGELGRTRIITQAAGYQMRLEPGELDVARMQALVGTAAAAARGCAWEEASAAAASAMLLWRGEPLADIGSAALARRIPQLTEMYRQAVDVRLEAELNLGNHAEAEVAYRLRAAGRDGGPARVVPRELPDPVACFTGRGAEFTALTALLESGARCVVLSASDGIAGAGTSSLARQWAHQVAGRFPDGQLYVDLGGGTVARSDALAAMLRSLGVPAQDIPPAEEERVVCYRRLTADRKILVVVDNARDEPAVRPLLPGTAGSLAVVTSRNPLARLAAARLELGPLPLADAVSLLRRLIGARAAAEPEATAALAQACSRLPLALRLAAQLAAGGSIAALASELAEQQARLALLDAGLQVQAVFRRSYDGLDPASARAFRLAGLHPGRELDPYAVAALTGSPVEQAGHVLGVLARAGLLQPAGPGRYRLHDLLRDFGRGLAAAHESRGEERLALTRLLDFYLAAATAAMRTLEPAPGRAARELPPFTDQAAALAWLDAERSSLMAAVALAAESHWPGHATRLAATLFGYLDVSGYFAEAIRMCGHARYAASRTGDRSAEATALLGLAIVDYRQARYQQSGRHLRQALARYRKAGDRTGETRAEAHLAKLRTGGGAPDAQIAGHRRDLVLKS